MAVRFPSRPRKMSRRKTWSLSRSEEHTSELQSRSDLVCRLLLEKKKKQQQKTSRYASMVRESDRNNKQFLPESSSNKQVGHDEEHSKEDSRSQPGEQYVARCTTQ